jgi:adenylate kinase family enzyme
MRRMQIIGCGGSGKSTFARNLGQILNLDVYHLDTIFWKPGWIEIPREKFIIELDKVFATDNWIMDGNYGGTMELRFGKSDTIIFLDLPTWICLFGAFRRRLTYRGRSRPDMTEGNEERITIEFYKWIFNYRRTRRPAILAMLERYSDSKSVIILKSRRQAQEFLERLERDGQQTCV